MRAYTGEPIAVALCANDIRVLSRSLKYHRPRSFFCLEGHCGACLMRIDGVPNLRACMEPCRPGTRVQGQNAYPSPDLDVLGAVDWLFPRGMDHHTLMTGSKVLNSVVNRMVRQLGGLGRLPDQPAAALPAVRHRQADLAIIGGGPAGLAAAAAAAHRGADVVLIDEQPELGGSLWADPATSSEFIAERIARARDAGAELQSASTAAAFYPEDDGGLLMVAGPEQMTRVRALRYLYATGGYAQNRLFANNDRPGVFAARAVARLLLRHRIEPGRAVCVLGDDDLAHRLANSLAEAGCDVIAIDGRERQLTGVRGRDWVEAILVREPDGSTTRRSCDLVAVSATPAPASEGPRQHGCDVVLRPEAGGFCVVTDAEGRTSAPDVFACGDVCGFAGPRAAAEAGERIGVIAAADALLARAASSDGARPAPSGHREPTP